MLKATQRTAVSRKSITPQQVLAFAGEETLTKVHPVNHLFTKFTILFTSEIPRAEDIKVISVDQR